MGETWRVFRQARMSCSVMSDKLARALRSTWRFSLVQIWPFIFQKEKKKKKASADSPATEKKKQERTKTKKRMEPQTSFNLSGNRELLPCLMANTSDSWRRGRSTGAYWSLQMQIMGRQRGRILPFLPPFSLSPSSSPPSVFSALPSPLRSFKIASIGFCPEPFHRPSISSMMMQFGLLFPKTDFISLAARIFFCKTSEVRSSLVGKDGDGFMSQKEVDSKKLGTMWSNFPPTSH